MNLVSFFGYLLVFAAPLGLRHLVKQFTPGFDEYASAFVYASDLILAGFLILGAKTFFFREIFSEKKWHMILVALAIFFGAAGISIGLAQEKTLAAYDFLRFFILSASAMLLAVLIKKEVVKIRIVFLNLVGIGVFESILSFMQFFYQQGIGLWFLGEPYLPAPGLTLPAGIARLDIYGGKLLRAYGTFPHPNILAAFLLLAFFALCYFWISAFYPWKGFWFSSKEKPNLQTMYRYFLREFLLGLGIFAVWMGLVFTFSRTAWIVGFVGGLLFVGYGLLFGAYRRQALRLLVVLAAVLYLNLTNFGMFIFPRAEVSALDPSLTYRVSYDQIGINLIKLNPLGVGLGNQVYYTAKNSIYQSYGLTRAWQWQPIHNIFLLAGVETGAVGLLALLIFIISVLFLGVKSALRYPPYSALLLMFLSILAFGLVDHFPWTLEPGRLMLWLTAGIILGISACGKKDG